MGIYVDTIQAIIDLLKVAASLIEGTDIHKYYFGIPTNPSGHPFIYVQYNGRTATGIGDTTPAFEYNHVYEIGVVAMTGHEDVAEKSVYDKILLIDAILNADANLNLGGNVTKMRMSRDVSIEHQVDTKKRTMMTWARIIHQTRTYE